MTAVIRPAVAADMAAVVRFAAAHNSAPRQRCLLVGETVEALTGDLDHFFEDPPEESFVLAENGAGIVAAVGCAVHGEAHRGWLIGPWAADGHWEATVPALFTALRERLGRRVGLFDAYVDVGAEPALRFLMEQGFRARKQAHAYVAPRPAALDLGAVGAEITQDDATALPHGADLLAEHEAAFLDLHARAFPEAPDPGPDLLERRGEDFRILAVADAEGLVGYICGQDQSSPAEGFIEYMAVEPRARGRGHGRLLLAQMLRWFFVDRGLPQAALTVDDTNVNARGLYESAGFKLHRTGLALRWPLCG